MDKFWIKHSGRKSKRLATLTEYFGCRAFRKQAPTQGKGVRDKRIELAVECPKKIKIIGALEGATSILIQPASPDEHTGHTQEDANLKKRNTFIKDIVAAERMKDYDASMVLDAVNKRQADLDAPGDATLKLYDVHNAGQYWRSANPNINLSGDTQPWPQQLTEASAYVISEGLFIQYVQAQVTIQGELRQEVAIVFGRRDLLAALKARGYLTPMDSTHQTNHQGWKLFTLMVRDEYGTWAPCAHCLSKFEDHRGKVPRHYDRSFGWLESTIPDDGRLRSRAACGKEVL